MELKTKGSAMLPPFVNGPMNNPRPIIYNPQLTQANAYLAAQATAQQRSAAALEHANYLREIELGMRCPECDQYRSVLSGVMHAAQRRAHTRAARERRAQARADERALWEAFGEHARECAVYQRFNAEATDNREVQA